jgi:hypothetical protein
MPGWWRLFGVGTTHRAVATTTAYERWGLERSGLCLRVHTTAEVDERHVALELRREPGGKQGLARLPACERVSEAEPRWQNRGISGGRDAFVPSISLGRGSGDSSMEGASSLDGGGDGLSPPEGLLVLLS